MIKTKNKFTLNFNYSRTLLFNFVTSLRKFLLGKKISFLIKIYQLKSLLVLRRLDPTLFQLWQKYLITLSRQWQIDKILPPLDQQKKIKVDLIIPWYGDRNIFHLIETIFTLKDRYLGYVYVINDGYKDEKLNRRLQQFCQKFRQQNLFYERNQINLGFVKTANLGMKKVKRDFILLNSDTIPQKNWLAYLVQVAYSDDKIATVTPMSNNATIFSWPKLNQANQLKNPVLTAEHLARFLPFDYFSVPTGHGFCLLIKYQIYQHFGGFDEEVYGKGYGEENDFCRRVAQAGYYHMGAMRALVLHLESQSFGLKQKKLLCQAHHQQLIARYPDYDQLVNNFITHNPLHQAQTFYNRVLKDLPIYESEYILIILHSHPFLGLGGVEISTQKLIKHLIKKKKHKNLLLYFYDQKRKCYQLIIIYQGQIKQKIIFAQQKPLLLISFILKFFHLKLIICEHLMYHHPDYLIYFKNLNLKVIWFIHDFYYLCQIPDLLVDSQAQNPAREASYWNQIYQKYNLTTFTHQEWQKRHRQYLSQKFTQAVIFNSEFLLNEYQRLLKLKPADHFYISYPDLESQL